MKIPSEIAKKILEILHSPGNKVISSKDLSTEYQDIALKNILILSKKMEESLNFVKTQIRKIVKREVTYKGGMLFYVADIGGSKTQFIQLVLDELHREWKNTPDINIIPVIFNNLGEVNVNIFNNSILSSTLAVFSEILDKETEKDILNKVINLSGKAQITLEVPQTMAKIFNMLGQLNQKYPDELFQKIRALIINLPIYDNEKLFEFLAELTKIADQYNILFLFCFDELDDWINEEVTDFREEFYKRQSFLRRLLDHSSNIKSFFIFACTQRVIELLKIFKGNVKAPALNRLSAFLNDALSGTISFLGNSILIREEGKYIGPDAETAILRFINLFETAGLLKPHEILFKDIISPLKFVIDNTYLRRDSNSKIISTFNTYQQIIPILEDGMRILKRGGDFASGVGKSIQDILAALINQFGYNYKLKHFPAGFGTGKMIDGLTWIDGKQYFGEIKYISKINYLDRNKLEQAIQSANYTKQKTLFFCCGEPNEEDIKRLLIKIVSIDPTLDKRISELIQPICINDPILLAAFVGVGDKFYDKNIMENLANWFDLLSDFPRKLMRIFPDYIPAKERLVPEDYERLPSELKEKLEIEEPMIMQEVTQTVELESIPHITAIKILENLRGRTGNIQKTMKHRLMENKFKTGPQLLRYHRYFKEGLQLLVSLEIIKSSYSDTIALSFTKSQNIQFKADPESFIDTKKALIREHAKQKQLG